MQLFESIVHFNLCYETHPIYRDFDQLYTFYYRWETNLQYQDPTVYICFDFRFFLAKIGATFELRKISNDLLKRVHANPFFFIFMPNQYNAGFAQISNRGR
jgi:hypothetical protein